jgi:putative ABC transport system permease protein
MIEKLRLHRWLQNLVLLLGMAGVALGLAIAIAARNGVEHQFDTLVDSIGRNLYRVATTSNPRPCGNVFTQEDVETLAANEAVLAVAASTAGIDIAFPEGPQLEYAGVTPDYFEVLGLPLASGRAFVAGETGVIVLGHDVSATLFDSDPVGQTLNTGFTTYEVIGVLDEIPAERPWVNRYNDHVFLLPADLLAVHPSGSPVRRYCTEDSYVVLWVRVDPNDPGAGLQAILQVAEGRADVRSISSLYDFTFKERRRVTRLYEFTALALLLIGSVNALTIGAASVAGEAQATGIRRALGATAWGVGFANLSRLLLVAGAGIVIGGGVAVGLAPLLSRLLSIPLFFNQMHLVGLGVLLGMTLLAGALPAYRAASVPPLRAVRRASAREMHPLGGMAWLVVLSAAVGIATVVFIAALTDSLQTMVDEMFGNVDRNTVVISGDPSRFLELPPYGLSDGDAAAIRAVDGIEAATCEFKQSSTLQAGDLTLAWSVFRAEPLDGTFLAGRLLRGRLPTEDEFTSGASVALIGPIVADRLFGDKEAIGQEVAIDDRPFAVIGLFRAPASRIQGVGDGESKVIVPYRALASRYGVETGCSVWLRLNPAIDPRETLAAVEQVLHDRHPDNAPAVIEGPAAEMGELIATINNMTYGLFRLALLALVISAAGFANLFWVRAMRQRHTLGIRRALGATSLRIFWDVFYVALLTTVVSGVAALGISIWGIHMIEGLIAMDLRFRPVWFLWTALAVLVAAGIGGGIPAMWAARLVPAETIRTGRE